MSQCFSCNSTLDFDRVYRSTECPGCGRAVKVCKNCRFYLPGAHWDCHETIPEAVREKDTVNFCDYFVLGSAGNSGDQEKSPPGHTEFDKLFDS